MLNFNTTTTAGSHSQWELIFLFDILKEVLIFIFDVGQLIRHLSLQQQISEVTLLQKPTVKFTKRPLRTTHQLRIRLNRSEKLRQMAWTRHQLHLLQEVTSTLSLSASIFVSQVGKLLLIVRSHELPYHFFGDVATDIFLVIAFRLHSLFFYFPEHMYFGGRWKLWRVRLSPKCSWRQIQDKRSRGHIMRSG